MAEAYAAYAAEVSRAMQGMLESTGVRVQPAAAFVPCGCGLNEHFIPPDALERHLFWYGSTTTGASTAVDQEAGGDGRSDELGRTTAEEGDDSDELRSLLEGAQSETKSGSAGTENGDQEAELRAAIAQVADSAGAFYERVRAWQRIPRAFARLIGPERDLVPASALRRWLKAELGRPGMLPEGELLDEELVEYVAGLLDHPDFCQPDLLVLELHEFLGRNVTSFVLALWKFLVVEMALNSVFKTEQNGVENAIQAQPARVNPELIEPPATAKTQPNNDTDPLVPSEREYKRRRASYRGKVGTKTGPAAFRELIQKHMVQLSLEADRELAHGGGFENKQAEDSRSGKRMRHEALNWRQFTDALAVRNRNRPGRRQSPSREKQRSRSKSRGDLRESLSRTTRKSRERSPSPERRGRSTQRRHQRSKSRSRSRSRSRGYRDRRRRGLESHHGSRRESKATKDRGRSESHRHGRRDDRHF